MSPTVTNVGGGLYQYAYSIAYAGPDDAFLIDIAVPDDPNAITNLTAPAGFADQFDSVNGLVSFLENTSTFTATPTSGFSFDSMDAPVTGTFIASLADSNGNISTVSGSTLAPAPEPSYMYLLGLMASALMIFSVFRKARTTNKPQIINPMETQYVSGT